MNPVNRNTMDEIYQSTVKKTEYLKRNGYNVVEMWECNMKRELEEDEDMKHYFDHYHSLRCEGDEQIKYVDFNSLYPKFLVRLHGEYNILVKLCGNTA